MRRKLVFTQNLPTSLHTSFILSARAENHPAAPQQVRETDRAGHTVGAAQQLKRPGRWCTQHSLLGGCAEWAKPAPGGYLRNERIYRTFQNGDQVSDGQTEWWGPL